MICSDDYPKVLFIQQSPLHKELIILKLSHSLNTDVGNNSYRELNESEWDNLFNEMMKLNYLVSEDFDDITKLEINKLITNSSSVFIVTESNSIEKWKGKGIYSASSLPIYDEYSNTDTLGTMVDDQIKKLQSHASMNPLFLLSWTLTQSSKDAALCIVDITGISSSIITLAQRANRVLSEKIYPEIAKKNYPNIIYIDNVIDDQATVLSMANNITKYMDEVKSRQVVIDAIDIIYGGNPDIQPPAGFKKLPHDLNKGTGGKYIYLCYKEVNITNSSTLEWLC